MPFKMPRISVILPVYNCEKYINETIQSVINQTFENFELLIIDDCSTDSTVAIIKSFNDHRIQLIQKEKNTGYTNSLNYAISIAKGEYVARMDGDDICLPKRFEKQVTFLDQNPNVILCGTSIQIIGKNKILHYPSIHDEIMVKLCFGNSFFHPSVMGRLNIFKENPYDTRFEPAEDYDLWTRLVFKGKLANLNEVLLMYRVHDQQISVVKNKYQTTVGYASQFRMLEPLIDFEEDIYIKMHIAFKKQEYYSKEDFKKSLVLFKTIQKGNAKNKVYSTTLFEDKLKNVKVTFLKNYFRSEGLKLNLLFFYFKIIKIDDFLELLKIRFVK